MFFKFQFWGGGIWGAAARQPPPRGAPLWPRKYSGLVPEIGFLVACVNVYCSILHKGNKYTYMTHF
jgi:hypothetical protein